MFISRIKSQEEVAINGQGLITEKTISDQASYDTNGGATLI